jgi:hypothetical protein
MIVINIISPTIMDIIIIITTIWLSLILIYYFNVSQC